MKARTTSPPAAPSKSSSDITRIAVAIRMRNDPQMGGSGWGLQIAMGVLIVILGIMCVFNPLSVMVSVGMMLGISIVFVGIDLIVGGFVA